MNNLWLKKNKTFFSKKETFQKHYKIRQKKATVKSWHHLDKLSSQLKRQVEEIEMRDEKPMQRLCLTTSTVT